LKTKYCQKNSIFFLLLITLFSSFIFFVNSRSPLVGEDLILTSWNYQSEPDTLIEKIDLVKERVVRQAMVWNARVGELASIVVGAFDKPVFNILNTVVIGLLVVLLFAIAFGRFPKKESSLDLFAIFILMVLCICLHPALGELFFWKSGTCNHTWGVVLLLIFFLPFRFAMNNETKSNFSAYHIVALSIIGLIAGFASEGSNVAVVCLLILFLTYWFFTNRGSFYKFLGPAVIFCVSTALFLTFPSTVNRRLYYENVFGVTQNPGFGEYISRLISIFSDYFQSTWLLLAVFLLLLLLAIVYHRKQVTEFFSKFFSFGWVKNDLIVFPIILITYISIISLISIPYNSDQQRAFAFNWYMLMSGISFLAVSLWKLIHKSIIKLPILLALTVLLAGNFITISKEYIEFNHAVLLRNSRIQNQINLGYSNISIEPLSIFSNRIIETREQYFKGNINTLIKNYYQVDSFIFADHQVDPFIYSLTDDVQYYLDNTDCEGGIISISGWAFLANKNSKNYPKFLVLKSIEKELFFSTHVILRKDVSSYYSGRYDSSGFSAYISEKDIEVGDYQIGIALKTKDGNLVQFTQKAISITTDVSEK
jgi:hypothetical protein